MSGRTTTPGNSVSIEMRGKESMTDRINSNSDSRLEDQTDRVRMDPRGRAIALGFWFCSFESLI